MPHTPDGAENAPTSRRAMREARQAESAAAADSEDAGFHATGIDAAATRPMSYRDLEEGDRMEPPRPVADAAAESTPPTRDPDAAESTLAGLANVAPWRADAGSSGAPGASPAPEAAPVTRPIDPAADAGQGGSGAGGRGAGPADAGGRKKRRGWRRGLIIAGIVLLVAVAWLGVRALMVKDQLEAAQRAVNHLQDGGTMEVTLPVVGEEAAKAASVRYDPVWRLAEFVPWVGDNLRGVRLSAEALDVMSNDVGVPALAEIDKDTDESIITRVLPIIEDARDDILRIADGIDGVKDSSALIPQVQTGVNLVSTVMELAAPAAEYGPELLGANGSRNYLLVFQNNAESVGLGGSAASQTLMSADQGSLAIVNQASSADYQEGTAVDVDVDQSALDLYSSYLVDHINTTPSRPDFPTMAELTTAFWQRDISDDQIDGVISIDPIALGYILGATGPITLETGDVMTSDNAVQLLLSDVYSRWNSYEDGDAVDAFFASVASQVFTKVSTGDFDIQTMLSALRQGIDGGDILFYSDNADLQKQIATEKVSGILPTDNTDQTTVGVFFRDQSASKIDYYMQSNVDLTKTCSADGAQFQVATTLNLAIDQASADALPDYVKNGNLQSAESFQTQVFVYGPPGTTVDSVQVDGRDVAVTHDDIDDLGRPVASFLVNLAPGEQGTVTATFSGDDDYGPLALRTTPMVQATTQALTDCE